MERIEFIRMAKNVVTKFEINKAWKEEHGRDWVFQIVDGLMALNLSDKGLIRVLYSPMKNKFFVIRE